MTGWFVEEGFKEGYTSKSFGVCRFALDCSCSILPQTSFKFSLFLAEVSMIYL